MATDKRLQVVLNSTYIEQEVSKILAFLLEIDLETSKTLGHTSSAFSFNHKLQLLMDLKIFDKTYFSKFQTFTEIRNQFAHNFSVNDFTTCCQFAQNVPGILNNYKVDPAPLNREEELTDQYNQLFRDVFNITNQVMSKSIDRMLQLGVQRKLPGIYEEMLWAIRDYAETDKEFETVYNNLISKFITSEKVSQENTIAHEPE